MAKRVMSFTLDTEADKDVARWLDRQENRSAANRAAIRAHLQGGGVTLGDIYQAVKALERRIGRGGGEYARTQTDDTDWDEPAEAAAALDALADL